MDSGMEVNKAGVICFCPDLIVSQYLGAASILSYLVGMQIID